jgi:predicted nuclease with TOPRIM domain
MKAQAVDRRMGSPDRWVDRCLLLIAEVDRLMDVVDSEYERASKDAEYKCAQRAEAKLADTEAELREARAKWENASAENRELTDDLYEAKAKLAETCERLASIRAVFMQEPDGMTIGEAMDNWLRRLHEVIGE